MRTRKFQASLLQTEGGVEVFRKLRIFRVLLYLVHVYVTPTIFILICLNTTKSFLSNSFEKVVSTQNMI